MFVKKKKKADTWGQSVMYVAQGKLTVLLIWDFLEKKKIKGGLGHCDEAQGLMLTSPSENIF